MSTRLAAVLILGLLALPAVAAESGTTPPDKAAPQSERIESPRERMMMMRRHRGPEGHETHYGMGWERRQGMGPMMMERGPRVGTPPQDQGKSE